MVLLVNFSFSMFVVVLEGLLYVFFQCCIFIVVPILGVSMQFWLD